MAAQRAKKIGARIKERREELGLTQGQLAKEFANPSVNKDYISRWERGVVEPSEPYLEGLATYLHTTVADLMAGPLDQRKPTPNVIALTSKNGIQLVQIEEEVGAIGVELATLSIRLEELQRSIAQTRSSGASGNQNRREN